MKHKYKTRIECSFHISERVWLEVKSYLEVSFPCINCERDRRTVIFKNIGARGICTPQKKCIGFPGSLNSVSIANKGSYNQAIFKISYNFHPFLDRKHSYETSLGATWARVHYIITCPKCLEATEGSTQSNLARPYKKMCNCGNILYIEKENPILIIQEN